jgi:hypothetical protein
LSTPRSRRALLAGLALLAVVVLSGCQVTTTVAVHAGSSGGGRVEVAVALDKDAAARMSGKRARTDDLARAGWRIEAPVRTRDGGMVLKAVKRFRSPAEAQEVVAEVGAVKPFQLTRARSFLRTRATIKGSIDLRRGAGTFSDPALQAKLGGLPLGLTPDRVAPVDKALRFALESHLLGTSKRWTAGAGQSVSFEATTEQGNFGRIVLGTMAGLAAVVFVLTTRQALRRGRRSTLLS